MAAPLETTQGALARRGFADPAFALRIVADWTTDHETLIDLAVRAPDPDGALRGLDRLRENRTEVLDELVDNDVLARQLIMVLGSSEGLAGYLAAQPAAVAELTAPVTQRSGAELRTELLTAAGADPEETLPRALGKGDDLRIAYRRALVRIAARDVCAEDPIEELESVSVELADLADATLEAALALARTKVGKAADTCRLAVIGLGKCGAQELNYVSDVDVLYLAEPAVGEDGEPVVTAQQAVQTATRLAAETTRICSAHTGAGTIWELDAALRPEGKAGPLVRTLASHSVYYEKWASTWEFQAMLKARPVAGDVELGQEFVDMIAPHVWRVAERDHFVADAQAMRRRVIDHSPAKEAGREIKLGPGGLRDVEFAVQLLQLVHGRADERLHTRGTLVSLRGLIDNGYVGREDGKAFGRAYSFLRALEHRIQLYRLRRTHLLPTDQDDLRRLGRSLGFADPAEKLMSTWRTCVTRVRRLHERMFYSPLLDAVARISSSELRLTTGAAVDRLKALGYADPKAALRHIAALSQGVTRQAEIQRQLLPAMLGWFAAAPNPDHGLLAFRRVSESLGKTPWYLRALRDEGMMAERMAKLLASSRYAVSLLTRAPQSVQLLASDEDLEPRTLAQLHSEMRAAARRQSEPAKAVEAVRAIRRRELFRVAAADILGLIDVSQVGEALADLASATIDAALAAVNRGNGEEVRPRIAMIAMGRWGGRELSYSSDADAMFVMADKPAGTDEGVGSDVDLGKVALSVLTELRNLLSKPGADPTLAIDAGLRPEGKGGAMIRSLSAYRRYYAEWSATWEMQALVRAEALAGDTEVGAELMAVIEEHRWPENGLTDRQLMEIRKLKARVEGERLPRGAAPAKHTKLGPGGLADVEWTVQLLQLQHAWRIPDLRTTRTMTALRVATEHELITPEDADELAAAWLMASQVRNQVMLVRGRASDSFPTDIRDLAEVAQLMGFGAAGASHLLAEYRHVTRLARQVVDRVFWGED